ncbi:MAG: rhodanese-like domain-containing protein [Clostridia bacterium]|nr:rhodanese-like domain-containing protein [Clostridia bacterium]
MNKRMVGVISALICIGVTACSTEGVNRKQTDSKNTIQAQGDSQKNLSYKNIKPEEAKKRLDRETGIILLDVRTLEEYQEKHIPNSLLIPVDVIEKEAPAKLTNKEAEIFVYCRSGRRSVAAAEALVKMGYSNVYNLGGIIDWPYETKAEK